MNFNNFCGSLDQIHKATGTPEKTKLLKEFFSLLKQQSADTFFLYLRLLVPELDRERPAYGIKKSKLVKVLTKMLNLPPGNDKEILSKIFKVSTINVGDIIYSVVKKYIVTQGDPNLTIEKVNEILDQIAARKSESELDTILIQTLGQLSPAGIRWFFQVLLKDVKVGVGHDPILNCFHPDAAEGYKANNNLRKLCHDLHNTHRRLNELALTLFEPFAPQLSKRCDAGNIRRCFSDTTDAYFIENKFDGERFQLHFHNGEYRYYSRNGFNYTDTFGASKDAGILTPIIDKCFGPRVNKLILDGEMMLWNTRTRSFGSKGLTFDVKKLKSGGRYQPCFCIFDILLFNERILTNKALEERLRLLHSEEVIAQQVKGSLAISAYLVVHSLEEIVKRLNESVDESEEGIIVKKPSSVYKFGDRNRSGWFKLKLEYFDDVVHDLDVVLIGGSYGQHNVINSFFVGVHTESNNYKSLGRIGSGLNAEQIDALNETFRSNGAKTPPKNVAFGKDAPNVYIAPEKSCLFQIRATELVRSTDGKYKTPYTLRFPRILGVRSDKPPNQCLSINELLDLTSQNSAVVKLSKRHLVLEEIPKAVKRRRVADEMVRMGAKRGDFLEGRSFFVHSGRDKLSVQEIYAMINNSGGRVVYDMRAEYDFFIASSIDSTVKKVISEQVNFFHVVSLDWLERIFEVRKFVDFMPNELYYFSRSFRNGFGITTDIYGDSFIAKTSKSLLMENFDMMRKRGDYFNMNQAVSELNVKCKKFAAFNAYFDEFSEINNVSSRVIFDCFMDKIEFRYYGGLISEKLDASVNLIVLNEEDADLNRRDAIEIFLQNEGLHLSDFKTVCKKFIYL